MEELIIKGTDHSPEVIFSPKSNTFSISGWSRPESPSKFYDPIVKWIEEHGEKIFDKATINFNIGYFNTASARMIRDVLEKLDALYKKGVKLNIVWCYDDIESKEEFEYEFAQGLELPVKCIKNE